jgi:hypothetical protein
MFVCLFFCGKKKSGLRTLSRAIRFSHIGENAHGENAQTTHRKERERERETEKGRRK